MKRSSLSLSFWDNTILQERQCRSCFYCSTASAFCQEPADFFWRTASRLPTPKNRFSLLYLWLGKGTRCLMAVLLEAFHASLLSATDSRMSFFNASAEAQCGRSVPLIDGYTHKCISRLTVFFRIVENMLCEITHKIAVLCFELIDRRADVCVFRRRNKRPFALQGAIAEE